MKGAWFITSERRLSEMFMDSFLRIHHAVDRMYSMPAPVHSWLSPCHLHWPFWLSLYETDPVLVLSNIPKGMGHVCPKHKHVWWQQLQQLWGVAMTCHHSGLQTVPAHMTDARLALGNIFHGLLTSGELPVCDNIGLGSAVTYLANLL